MPASLAARLPMIATVMSAALILAGCCDKSTPGATAGTTPPVSEAIPITTSTNVWGDVIKAVGGSAVSVTSIISDPSMDPHSYESTPADATKVTDASLVVFNGAGYDEFLEKILESTKNKQVIEVHQIAKANGVAAEEHSHEEGEAGHKEEGHKEEAGHKEDEHKEEAGHQERNEHYWYDLDLVRKTAERIAAKLSEIRPTAADVFQLNASRFTARIDEMTKEIAGIATSGRNSKILLTEAVAANLVHQMKLTDATPKTFANAVEEQSDPPASAVAAVQRLISSRAIAAVLYNPQTEGPIVQRLKDRAVAAGIPVINTTETLPEGMSYLDWMAANIANVAKALK